MGVLVKRAPLAWCLYYRARYFRNITDSGMAASIPQTVPELTLRL